MLLSQPYNVQVCSLRMARDRSGTNLDKSIIVALKRKHEATAMAIKAVAMASIVSQAAFE